MGTVEHSHMNESGEPAHIIQEKMHSQIDDGNVGGVNLQEAEGSDTWKQSHRHLPSTIDHLHDSWFFRVGIMNSHVELSAFMFHADTDAPRQNALDRIKKPPRDTLKS